jgi:hypothetical protein
MTATKFIVVSPFANGLGSGSSCFSVGLLQIALHDGLLSGGRGGEGGLGAGDGALQSFDFGDEFLLNRKGGIGT